MRNIDIGDKKPDKANCGKSSGRVLSAAETETKNLPEVFSATLSSLSSR